MRKPGVGPSPVPLILTHGWPWTFWHWAKVVDPLADPGAHGGDPADAFDVIVPSFPGFGFSTPLPKRPDMNFWKVADLWHTLMTGILGYENPPGVTTTEQRVENFLAGDRAPWYNHVNLTAHDHGGHFIPWENPDAWVDDLRRTFRGRR
jgi:pimeloyl-ACP methyl ester carboxylesterase